MRTGWGVGTGEDERARVIVTPGVGETLRLTARLRDGRRPVEILVDRRAVPDAAIERLIRVMERVLRRYDPERRHLRLIP